MMTISIWWLALVPIGIIAGAALTVWVIDRIVMEGFMRR